MYLKIKNKGEVPVEAFTLVGASTKRDDDSKIGMFGSGNKYAMAYLLRNGHDTIIFSGTKRITVTVNPVKFGNEEIGVIAFNGKESSITTDMGPKWTLWQAIRELYSNAVDEGKLLFEIVDDAEINSEDGTTSIYVEADDQVCHIINNFNLYFSEETPFLYKKGNDKILQKVGTDINVFRKGIRCYDLDKESLYDYDIEALELNESRIVESTTDLMSAMWRVLIECDNEVVIKDLLDKLGGGDIFEYNEYVCYWSKDQKPFSEAWRAVLKDRFVCPREVGGFVEEYLVDKTFMVPKALYTKILKELGKEYDALKSLGTGHIKFSNCTPTALEADSIKKALEFFGAVGYEIAYPIEVAKFYVAKDENNRIMGLSDSGTIYINRSAFDKGLFFVATVIYEENFHIKTGLTDRTRAMQDGLIEDMLTYMKKSNSINL